MRKKYQSYRILPARTVSATGPPGGGGGGQGPLLCHDVGFLTLGPKLDPRLAHPFLLVDLIWNPPPPPFKNPGSAPVMSGVIKRDSRCQECTYELPGVA